MHRLILLALLILAALPLQAEQIETIEVTSQSFSQRLGDNSDWHLTQLNEQTYVYDPEAQVYTLTNGRFVLPTPCGLQVVPLPPQEQVPLEELRDIAQPCIAIHTIAYDIIAIMTRSDTAQLTDNNSLTFRNTYGTVVLSRVPER